MRNGLNEPREDFIVRRVKSYRVITPEYLDVHNRRELNASAGDSMGIKHIQRMLALLRHS